MTYRAKHRLSDANSRSGIIDSQTEVGGWPLLRSQPGPVDSDHDGIPDEWERLHGLDPNNPLDGASLSSDGSYTYLEVYLSSLAD